jgi:hypothetical protein
VAAGGSGFDAVEAGLSLLLKPSSQWPAAQLAAEMEVTEILAKVSRLLSAVESQPWVFSYCRL